MKKESDRVYSEGFDIPLWLKTLIVLVFFVGIVWLDAWLVCKVLSSDLPLWFKVLLLG